MSIAARFRLPASAFALDQTFERVEDATVEAERLATHSSEWVMPFVWVTSDSMDRLIPAMRHDPTVETIQVLDRSDHIGHFNVVWDEDVQAMVDEIVDMHGAILEASGGQRGWVLRLQFVDRDALGAFRTYLVNRSIDFDLLTLNPASIPKGRTFDLTAPQREVLMAALDEGYFEVPRDGDISDLADRLDISTNAVSERLRRATGTLVENALATEPPAGT